VLTNDREEDETVTVRKLAKTKDIPNETSAILTAAADYMDARGYTRNRYQTSDGKCCGAGAVRAVCGIPNMDGQSGEWVALSESERTRRVALVEIAQRAVTRSGVTYPYHFIIGWSDSTDKKTVVAGLRKAAEWAKTHPVAE
jgi:hypothetical protein